MPYAQAALAAPDAPASSTPAADHRISAGDVILVQVFNVDKLTTEQTVDSSGRITMPLLGPIEVQGKTSAEVASHLTALVGKDLVRSPNVTVVVKSAVLKTMTVDGSVKQPGVYPVGPTTSLIQAVALARGADEGANIRRVVIFRQINGKRHAAAFDLASIRKGLEPDPKIYGDDIVVVDGSRLNNIFRTTLQTIPLVALFRPF